MLLRWRSYVEGFRASLFFVPALFVLAAVALITLTNIVDTRFDGPLARLPLLRAPDPDNVRQVLGTIAGATITVAGIVFSVMVVAVQLASSQFSPRVLHGFLRDRFSQVVIGVVVGTFTYCLLGLSTMPGLPGDPQPASPRNLTLTVAVALGVASVLAIVAFIDHSARTVQVGEIIRRTTAETRERISRLLPYDAEQDRLTLEDVAQREPDGPRHVVRARTDGWIRQIDHEAILDALPAGTTARLETTVGDFLIESSPFLTVWPPPDDPDALDDRVDDALDVGPVRTMQQDIAFGIRQLVDIALRALSPGINDPTTAYDAVVNLGAILADLMQRQLPSRVIRRDDRTLLRPHDLGIDAYVGRAFDQIRQKGADYPAVALLQLEILSMLDDLMRHRGLDHRRRPLREQARLVVATVERSRPLDGDTAGVRRRAESHGLLPDP